MIEIKQCRQVTARVGLVWLILFRARQSQELAEKIANVIVDKPLKSS